MGEEEKRNYSKEYQEMIQIEEGLEQFLEQELQDMRSAQTIPDTVSAAGCRTAAKTTNNAEEVTMANTKNTKRRKPSKALPDDYRDDWDKAPSSGHKKISAKKQKNMRWKRFLITIVLLIALLGLVHYCLVASVYAKMNYKAIENKSITDAPLKEDGVINILLIGNDSRQNGEDGRSDAMILLSISTKTKKIYMTSLLRDMYVEIPGHDGNRLNAAYAYGGAGLLMQTIEQNLDISVNRYMLVNFEAFANLVDAVEGIELELSSEEVAYVNGYLEEYNILTKRPEGTDYMDTSLSGMLHLNGPQALAYTRNRYLGTDFGRTERQRKVLSAVIKKLPKAAVTNSKELMDGLLPNLTTNLTQNECYLLSFYAPKLLTYELVQNSIPMDGTYKNANIRGMAVLEVDFDANKKFIRENVYGK
ncbi:MAG: LCP family protein [Bacteroidales bacterium]|nr:LCP family protein [Lachnoclostridium sp.]MCM1384176.1 LCP family protein [Lachnoclostridium sp.]MCM1464842.1 LCP family protein [Bacteroidales bacterium]